MSQQQLLVSLQNLVDCLFQFEDVRQHFAHKQFFQDMVTGILGSKSTLLANIARFLRGFGTTSEDLQTIENRLSRGLANKDMRIFLQKPSNG